MIVRELIVDTETTGLDPTAGHRVIEIGCVELVNRKRTGNDRQWYINPQRDIDEAAFEVHGISSEFLSDKPIFESLAKEVYDYVKGARLVIHNAPFDVAFLDHEFKRVDWPTEPLKEICPILDTLVMARKMHPGSRNSLDALCKRYGVDNSNRTLHGALLDAEILSDVYRLITGGQTKLNMTVSAAQSESSEAVDVDRRRNLTVVKASEADIAAHNEWLDFLDKQSDGGALWFRVRP